MRKWKIEDSAELYNINGWGLNYFSINEKGHVSVCPKAGGPSIDLEELMEELQIEDVAAPVLLRFPDILNNRIEKISSCFEVAAQEYGFTAKNYIIYPIKVNQMRPVVEEIVSHGNKFNIGLEAGSKPELHAVLSIDIDSDAMIICNGYKDESYIELALLAQKMGRQIFIVVEKMKELKMIASVLLRKEAKYIHEMQAYYDNAVADEQKGMFAYLLGLEYKYKNDTRKSKKYLKEALQKLKGTPYEEEIRGLLSESAE